MVVAVNTFMGMPMRGFILSLNMGMGVDMGMRMGMQQITMPVRMIVDMGMFVGVLQGNGGLDHQHCGNYHNGKANVELHSRPFSNPQQQAAPNTNSEPVLN